MYIFLRIIFIWQENDDDGISLLFTFELISLSNYYYHNVSTVVPSSFLQMSSGKLRNSDRQAPEEGQWGRCSERCDNNKKKDGGILKISNSIIHFSLWTFIKRHLKPFIKSFPSYRIYIIIILLKKST